MAINNDDSSFRLRTEKRNSRNFTLNVLKMQIFESNLNDNLWPVG